MKWVSSYYNDKDICNKNMKPITLEYYGNNHDDDDNDDYDD